MRGKNDMALSTTDRTEALDSQTSQGVRETQTPTNTRGPNMKECKHKYEPTNFGIKYRKPDTHWWSCIRCGNTIFAELKERA